MKTRTLGQKRANYALEKVLAIPENTKKDFKSFSAGAPSTILQNGFGQAMAYWLSKGTDKNLKIKKDDKHIVIFNMIREWLSYKNSDVNNNFIKKTSSETEFVKELSDLDQRRYLAAQREALALLEWVKRYANAGLE
ncbi:MAG: type III-B CRISPR module-associated protein Cmr5 [Deltaproteobacteria bacterium]|nr:type III-B CRISPR module-associated protein Cmr5 [Deltaproteobacteria bacterium]MBW1920176.1 type III-B CRISPR module-associated protein Cmr5 [Deltaproteobacteria bacterium]MBW1934820.1 type III-B CRISPR module-associated protein Cmr5 [Deltaproteobacteria bacterium]MBW1979089.1 type III-B CRISPR module-associated protein Cmr5 [Deltaproteobacteria bacterium]MBW2045733.1 type III-B CRISPR module-associated protein Cmr5 [Deltaproteobacteria bacterium]